MTIPAIQQNILVVEDEQKLALLLCEYLEAAGYQVHCLNNGDEVLPWLKANHADLLVLDLMLPGVDGISLCQKIRGHSDLPIIMATARVEEADRLQGLEMGADDYVCKPYSLKEMVARVTVILKRVNSAPRQGDQLAVIGAQPFDVNAAKRRIRIYGELLDLTPVEFRLLEHLLAQPEIVFTRDELLDIIYDDYRLVSDRTIDSHIKNLRKKIHQFIPDQELIHSVYGVGYKFEFTPAQAAT
ncbi:MAG: response regulator [Pontibacterium sp.]